MGVPGGSLGWGGGGGGGGGGMGGMAQPSFPDFTPKLAPTFSGAGGGNKWDSWGEQLSISSASQAFGADSSCAGAAPPKEPDAPECSACNIKFTQSIRRHHCRSCGRCVCQYCSPSSIEMASLDLKGEQRCCLDCHEFLSKGRSSSLERVFSLITRAEEEHMKQLATRELLEYCAVATDALPEKVTAKVVEQCSIGGPMVLTALTAVSKMASRSETKRVLVDKGVRPSRHFPLSQSFDHTEMICRCIP